MKEIPFHNDGQNTRYVAGIAIPPGEVRMVPENRVPRVAPQAAAPELAADPEAEALERLLEHSVREMGDLLPEIEAGLLDRLEAAEQAKEKPRSTLLAAIAEERLRRADAAENDGTDETGAAAVGDGDAGD
jgi:hypothetical protein